jgi:hypothetical protein
MSKGINDGKVGDDLVEKSECLEVISLRSRLSLREKQLADALQITQAIYASPGWKMIEQYRAWVERQRLMRPRLIRSYEVVALWLLSKLGANRSTKIGLNLADAQKRTSKTNDSTQSRKGTDGTGKAVNLVHGTSSAQLDHDSVEPSQEFNLKSRERFDFSLERLSAYLGRLFVVGAARHQEKGIKEIELIFNDSTVTKSVHIPAGESGSFNITANIPPTQTNTQIGLRFVFDDMSAIIVDARKKFNENDPVRHVRSEFVSHLGSLSRGKVLEIGSRARSGHDYRHIVPRELEYVGLDILAGPNVDIVGDAHKLSRLFPSDSFDGLYSIAVFEHLMMPWLVVLEMNKVMKVGAVGWIVTHQTFPLHEIPWDFWRYSIYTWRALFNKSTGFEVIDARMGEPVTIVGNFWNVITQDWDRASAFMSSQVCFRKVSGTKLAWAVDPEQIAEMPYPA